MFDTINIDNVKNLETWDDTITLVIKVENIYSYYAFRNNLVPIKKLYEEDLMVMNNMSENIPPLTIVAKKVAFFPFLLNCIFSYFDLHKFSIDTKLLHDNYLLNFDHSVEWSIIFLVSNQSEPFFKKTFPWYLPVGVIYDIFTQQASSIASSNYISLTLSFEYGYSSSMYSLILMPPIKQNPWMQLTKQHFYSQLKMADWLRWKQSCNRVHGMSKQDQLSLFELLYRNCIDPFNQQARITTNLSEKKKWWSILKDVLLSEDTKSFGIPVRLYILSQVREEICYKIKLLVFPSWNLTEERYTTVGDLISETKYGQYLIDVKTQGFLIDLATPLLFLQTNACYAETLVHIILKIKN